MPKTVRRAAWHLALAVCAIMLVFPVLWAVVVSLTPANEIFRRGILPSTLTLEHYARALSQWPVASLFTNTIVMAVGVTLGQTVIAVLGAFALDAVSARFRRAMLALLAIALALPAQTLVIPQFLLATKLGWLNTPWGLIIPQWGAVALAVILMLQHVRAIPPSLPRAARLEGAGASTILWRIVLPAILPACAAVGILVFISAWNEYLWPLLIAPNEAHTTVQIGLSQFRTAEGTNYGGFLAAAVITCVPVVVVYLAFSRQITDAFMKAGTSS